MAFDFARRGAVVGRREDEKCAEREEGNCKEGVKDDNEDEDSDYY